MATVYSRRFGIVTAAAGAHTFTVPAGKVWILKCVDVVNRSGGNAVDFWLQLQGGPIIVYGSVTSASGPNHGQWTGHHVFSAGEILVTNSQANAMDWILSGYELTL